MSAPRCEAVVAEFIWGGERCGEPAAAVAIDPTWGTEHPVCAEHAETEDASP